MLKVKLPDGSVREYQQRVRPIDVAGDIGPGLAKATVAAEVDGQTVDSTTPLPSDGEIALKILTKRDPEALRIMRHSCAHVMARAVMRLFDGVQLAFGPTTENGFYYDMKLPRSLSESDFPAIEAEMAKIVKANEPFERIEEPRDKALELCRELGQEFKVEHIGEGLADQASLSFYRQGEFIDLCRGRHIPAAGAIGAFKLLNIAGAYWKGDQSREQLQRLYGTAWFSKDDLENYLKTVEEAKRRDHRVLGKQLELFTTSPLVGGGLILWLPKGAVIRGLLENFTKEELTRRGYTPVYTPHIGKIDLYKISGHYPYYADSQFKPIFQDDLGAIVALWRKELEAGRLSEERGQLFAEIAEKRGARKELIDVYKNRRTPEGKAHLLKILLEQQKPRSPGQDEKDPESQFLAILETDQESYVLKPMNCPHHIMIYKSKPRSYRDLPVRLSEFGTVYRYEQSGELGGLTRVRGFTQDDAHIFCTEDQVAEEFRGCIDFTQTVLKALGLNDYRARLGFRDPASDKYVGSAESWNKAERAIEQVAREMNLPGCTPELGEAAFYGPKVDFVVADCLGREWQLGTVQLDYNLPSAERFGLEYIGADNQPHRPVMIHRAPLGSMERFIGVLIEHFAGAFPLWLAPEQVRVMSLSEKVETFAREVEVKLRAAGFRATGDYRAEKINSKIRDAQLELIPYMFVIGGKEAAAGTVAVRDRIEGDLGAMPLDTAIEKLAAEVKSKQVRQVAKLPTIAVDQVSANEY